MGLRIGFLTPEYVTDKSLDGGLANYVKKTAFELMQRGHSVTVFVLSDRNRIWKDGMVEVIEVERYRLANWLNQGSGRIMSVLAVLAQVRSAKRIERAVWNVHRKTPIDLLHASSYMSPGFTLRKNGKIPVVCRISSYSPLLRAAYGFQHHLSDYLKDWLEIRQVLDSDASFAPSRFLADTFAQWSGRKPGVIPTPPAISQQIAMDESIFHNRLAKNPYLLFFGTLSKIKGIDLLAGAIPQVWKQYPNIRFVFIGRDDGTPERAKIMDLVREKCAARPDGIEYLPAIPKSQLYPVIRNAQGVLLPSRVDNCPNACLEAQSLSVPVIGTFGSSLEEMIQDGCTGFLARNGDPDDLAAAILKLLHLSREESIRMKEHIQLQFQRILAEDRIGQLENLYLSTIRNFKPGI